MIPKTYELYFHLDN